jgi:branched-chain amino acid transport system substrate-binding protein
MSDSLLIGIAGPLTGKAAGLGKEMKQAAELAMEECNMAGGVLGRTVGVEVADDEGDVGRGENVARKFGERPELLGVVGHYNSDVTITASAIYRQYDLPVISPIASNPMLTERGFTHVFRLTNRDDHTAAAIAQYLRHTMQKQRAVVVETNTMYGKSMAQNFANAFADLGGNILVRHMVEEGQAAFNELVDSLPRNFDLLFYGGTFEGAPLLRTMRSYGLNQLFVGGDGCWDVNNFLKPAGEAATLGEGVLVLSATPEVGAVSGSREFARNYERKFGPIFNYAVNSYDAAHLVFAAIEHAATESGHIPTRTQVIAAVCALKYQGVAYHRPHEWDEKGDNLAAVTALHVIEGNRYRQIAESPRGNTEFSRSILANVTSLSG